MRHYVSVKYYYGRKLILLVLVHNKRKCLKEEKKMQAQIIHVAIAKKYIYEYWQVSCVGLNKIIVWVIYMWVRLPTFLQVLNLLADKILIMSLLLLDNNTDKHKADPKTDVEKLSKEEQRSTFIVLSWKSWKTFFFYFFTELLKAKYSV